MQQQYTDDQRQYLLQFRHPEKVMAEMPGVSDETMAALEGLDGGTYRRVRRGFAHRAREAAGRLLEDADLARRVGALPFEPGQVVVGFGDSITDDLQSWFEILRRLVAARRPDAGIEFVNLGYSGDSTTHAICRFAAAVALRPDWILCMLGTNDVRLHGRSPAKTLVSPEETERNFAMLRDYARNETHARWVWLTPARVIEDRIRVHWWLGRLGLMWRNEDLDGVADIVRRQPGPVVDLQEAFGAPVDPALLLDDGLHPSLAGQERIAAAVVCLLSDGSKP
jgi:lysophospholipase L1-like esterase